MAQAGMVLNLMTLPIELIMAIMEHLLPCHQEIDIAPKQYFSHNNQVVPRPSPVPRADFAILAVNKYLYEVGHTFMYGNNLFIFHFRSIKQIKWGHKRHGIFIEQAQPNPLYFYQPRVRHCGSLAVSSYLEFPAQARVKLHRVKIEVTGDFRNGFVELRECFESFAKTARMSPNLKFIGVHLTHKHEIAFWDAGSNAPLDKTRGHMDQQNIQYMLEPLVDLSELTGAKITGDVNEKFARDLAGFMMAKETKVLRLKFRLGLAKLEWAKRVRTTLG